MHMQYIAYKALIIFNQSIASLSLLAGRKVIYMGQCQHIITLLYRKLY